MTKDEAARKGGLARAKQFTSASQKKARSKVSSEACARNGAKGAQATLAKYGYEVLFKASRQKRLDRPSKPELLMIALLSTLGLAFEREYILGESTYTCDFYLPGHNKAVEVHGRIHRIFEVEKRQKRDEHKRELLARLGIECLWIDEEELKNVLSVAEKIKEFVGVGADECSRGMTGTDG